MKHLLKLTALLLLAPTAALYAADAPKQGWNPDTTFPPLSPGDAIKTMAANIDLARRAGSDR